MNKFFIPVAENEIKPENNDVYLGNKNTKEELENSVMEDEIAHAKKNLKKIMIEKDLEELGKLPLKNNSSKINSNNSQDEINNNSNKENIKDEQLNKNIKSFELKKNY